MLIEITIDESLAKLLEMKVTKWAIKKYLNTNWNNVHAWSRGWYQPRPHHKEKLKEMLEFLEKNALEMLEQEKHS